MGICLSLIDNLPNKHQNPLRNVSDLYTNCVQIVNKLFMFWKHQYSPVLTYLFKTTDRISLLRYALYNPPFTVQQAANVTGVSKALVSRYLARLVEEGLLTKRKRTYQWKNTAFSRAVKILLNISYLEPVVSLPTWAKGIGIYGSWAEGTNTIESDLDVWIYVDTIPAELEIATLRRIVEKKFGVEVHVLILTVQKFRQLQEDDIPFAQSLLKTMIVLEGESLVIS
jgi:predicted nucleotidyltransferase